MENNDPLSGREISQYAMNIAPKPNLYRRIRLPARNSDMHSF
jgi:hypothetical protein